MTDETNGQDPGTPSQSKGLGRRWVFGKDVSSWPMQKVAHAAQRKAELESRISLWTAGFPIETESTLSEDRRKWETRLRVHVEPPSQEWSLILGDLLYSLRSALDACVWEFAHMDGATPRKPKLVQFPVVRDRADWGKALRERLQSVPREVAERIEMVQPFNRPPEQVAVDPLVLLSELNNMDKHCASISVSVDPHGIQQNVSVTFDSEEASERNAPPNITYHFPGLADQALVVEACFVDPAREVRGGVTVGMRVTAETPIGKEGIGVLGGGLVQNVRDVLNFIAVGPPSPEELAEMNSQNDGEWLPLDIQADDSGRTFTTGARQDDSRQTPQQPVIERGEMEQP
ncbi:hypothetical protein [Streptomyces venezuelae]|uniref:hypothetical protein n=1 Tax=Streptomyces venezuelae TaxID=54571 RepID=UPI0036362544